MSAMLRAFIADAKAHPDAAQELADVLAPYLPAPAAPPDDDRWMSTREAAEYLGTTPSGLNNRTAARDGIPFEQDSPRGPCRFKKSELDAWRRKQWTR